MQAFLKTGKVGGASAKPSSSSTGDARVSAPWVEK